MTDVFDFNKDETVTIIKCGSDFDATTDIIIRYENMRLCEIYEQRIDLSCGEHYIDDPDLLCKYLKKIKYSDDLRPSFTKYIDSENSDEMIEFFVPVKSEFRKKSNDMIFKLKKISSLASDTINILNRKIVLLEKKMSAEFCIPYESTVTEFDSGFLFPSSDEMFLKLISDHVLPFVISEYNIAKAASFNYFDIHVNKKITSVQPYVESNVYNTAILLCDEFGNKLIHKGSYFAAYVKDNKIYVARLPIIFIGFDTKKDFSGTTYLFTFDSYVPILKEATASSGRTLDCLFITYKQPFSDVFYEDNNNFVFVNKNKQHVTKISHVRYFNNHEYSVFYFH